MFFCIRADRGKVKNNFFTKKRKYKNILDVSPKLNVISDLLNGKLKQKKIVIFSRYIQILRIVEKLCGEKKIPHISLFGDSLDMVLLL